MPDFGKLEYSAKEMNFIYRGTVYAVSDYPYEPCLYLKKDGRLLSVIHNSFTVDNLIRVFSEGGSVHDVDRESTAYDEAAFSRVLGGGGQRTTGRGFYIRCQKTCTGLSGSLNFGCCLLPLY